MVVFGWCFHNDANPTRQSPAQAVPRAGRAKGVNMYDEFAIIEGTRDARREYGYAWGGGDVVLTLEHLRALLAGKVVAHFDGEYMHFIELDDDAKAAYRRVADGTS
jgi:hypothetical protein